MNNVVAFTKARQASPLEQPSLEERRCAPWLHSSYSADVWVVSNPEDPDDQRTIDFRIVMPDGRSLVQHQALYRTVKEFAWWFRDPRFSKVENLDVYVTRVGLIMYLAHGLSLRRVDCFSKLLQLDIEEITNACVVGVDGVVKASDRLATFLGETPIGALPLLLGPGSKAQSVGLNRKAVLERACIPARAVNLPRLRFLIDHRNIAEGFRLKRPALTALPPHEPITSQRLSDWLTTFELLLSMRGHLEAPTITFKPYARGAARVAAVKGSVAARTPTAPPKLALTLLERAMVWIADRAPIISSQQVHAPGRRDVEHLATACWIVIATFSARRNEEIDELEAGCAQGSNKDGWWLHVDIVKTLQAKTLIPIPGIVTKAIQTLEALSEEARLISGEQRVFQWLDPRTGHVVDLVCGNILDRFAREVGLPDHVDRNGVAAPWHWSPHQFRRFFAILYFWRFDGSQLEALSHHLRHFSLEMTRRYITEDSEVAAIWHDTEWGFRSDMAHAFVTGERSFSGSMGAQLELLTHRLKEGLRAKVRVIRPDQAESFLVDATASALSTMMDRKGLVLTPKPWVTCSCPRTANAASKAACRQDSSDGGAIGPDFARAGPTVCSKCPFAIFEANRSGFVAAERDHLRLRQGAAPGTILAQLEEARLVELDEVLSSKLGGSAS
jgi:hypothetical protein